MEQEHRNIKPLLLAATAAVTVIAVLLVFFFSGRKTKASQTIVLPDPPAQEETAQEEPEQNASLASVSTENVQSVLEKSVFRPTSYHQTMTITTVSGEKTRVQTAEVWVKGKLLKVQLTDDFETRTVLADEQTLYLWYDDEETPVSMARGAAMRLDDLAGVPSYEDILTFSRSQLLDASFVTLPDTADCIYVSVQNEDTQLDYWVSLESGLLCKQNRLLGGELVYDMEQTALEVYPDSDEALDGVFTLPDGTEPFAPPQN